MTEIEKIDYARRFIEKLARGINPLDGSAVKDDDLLNNPRIKKCMEFVDGVLRQVVENRGFSARNGDGLLPFCITPEELAAYSPEPVPLNASSIAGRLSDLVDRQKYKALNVRKITEWLVQIGALRVNVKKNGKKEKRVTDFGLQLGLFEEPIHGERGDFISVKYNENAQRFIADNIFAITENPSNNEP